MKIETDQVIQIIDFWQKSVKKDTLLERAVIGDIMVGGKDVVDLVGPRRSGKSFILKLLIERLNVHDNFLYINFEDPFFIENNKPHIIEEIVLIFQEYFNKDLKYIFFDEIQEIDQWEKALRKLRDSENFKIFITGSSSKLLSREMSSLLTGRHLSYKIFPLSFAEFLDFRGFTLKHKKDISIKEKQILKEFGSYSNIGGFPAVVLSENQELLKNYFFDILQKDIATRHQIREKDVLERMAVYLLTNSGKIISIESLKKTFSLSFVAASSYLEYFKDAFLVFDLPQFSYSLKKQSKALKKIYSVDTGLANNVSFKFSEDKGRILENIVFLEIKRRGEEVFYYRTKDGTEVDFFTREKFSAKNLIQVAWSVLDEGTRERELRSLFSAMEETKLKSGLILTYNDKEETITIDKKTITIKPVYKWLLGK